MNVEIAVEDEFDFSYGRAMDAPISRWSLLALIPLSLSGLTSTACGSKDKEAKDKSAEPAKPEKGSTEWVAAELDSLYEQWRSANSAGDLNSIMKLKESIAVSEKNLVKDNKKNVVAAIAQRYSAAKLQGPRDFFFEVVDLGEVLEQVGPDVALAPMAFDHLKRTEPCSSTCNTACAILNSLGKTAEGKALVEKAKPELSTQLEAQKSSDGFGPACRELREAISK